MGRNAIASYGDVSLAVVKRRDAKTLQVLLESQRAWLSPWEATVPGMRSLPNARWLISGLLAAHKEQTALPLVIFYRDELVGQINVSNILCGSVSSATLGYWISSEVAGRGIMPLAVALTIEHCFSELGLHRIEIDIRPENQASLRVVQKLGLRHEGTKLRFIHIDGAWRDHEVFAMTKEEFSSSFVTRLGKEHTQKNLAQ